MFDRFLARLFAEPGRPWLVKGGTNLLIRLPSARFSKDIDLLYRGHAADDVNEAADELRRLVANGNDGDHVRFEIGDPKPIAGQTEHQPGANLKVDGFVGSRLFGTFPVDLSMKLRPIARPDLVRLEPIITLPGDPEPPQVSLYPLPDQIADKVCAMYSTYRTTNEVSSRYHDLVDLVLIITTTGLDGAETTVALHEEAARRTGLRLPGRMASPGPTWAAGYGGTARQSPLDPRMHDLKTALTIVGRCLDPLLARQPVTTWDPVSAEWRR
nr:nucleotidyl transferase AbiEii/AbiGii toxin family protein [Streptomyces sp. SID13031]